MMLPARSPQQRPLVVDAIAQNSITEHLYFYFTDTIRSVLIYTLCMPVPFVDVADWAVYLFVAVLIHSCHLPSHVALTSALSQFVSVQCR